MCRKTQHHMHEWRLPDPAPTYACFSSEPSTLPGFGPAPPANPLKVRLSIMKLGSASRSARVWALNFDHAVWTGDLCHPMTPAEGSAESTLCTVPFHPVNS